MAFRVRGCVRDDGLVRLYWERRDGALRGRDILFDPATRAFRLAYPRQPWSAADALPEAYQPIAAEWARGQSQRGGTSSPSGPT